MLQKEGRLQSHMKFSEVNLSSSTVDNNVKILNQSCRILCNYILKLVLVGASVLSVGKLIIAADLKTSCFHNHSF